MKFFEDFTIGEKIVTPRRTITEADIVNFCMFSGDWYPLHADAEYARQSPFGGRIAHGMLVLSACSGLLPLTEFAIAAFYGMDRVRFTGPTRIGDTLRVELEVTEKNDKGDFGGVVTFESRIRNQKDEDAVVYVLKIVMAHKPAE